MTTGALNQAIRSIEDRVKAEVAKEFTRLAYGALSPANTQPWNHDGFYTARQASELAEHGFLPSPLERDFAVSEDCPYWGAPFTAWQQVFRGFLRHAWLPLPAGPATGVVAIAVHGSPEGIHASVGGVVLEPLTTPSPSPSLLFWHIGGADPQGVLHLHSDAPAVFSPERGRMSSCVGKPFWLR